MEDPSRKEWKTWWHLQSLREKFILVIILSIFIVLTILVFGILILIQNFIFFIFLVLDLRDEEKKKRVTGLCGRERKY
jgi:hypothetical protein